MTVAPAAKPRTVLIAVLASNGVIGGANRMLWRLSEDQRFFSQTTRGHAVIMGRKTWDSLPERFRPLPERSNWVVTRRQGWHAPGAQVVASLEAALAGAAAAAPGQRIFVIGGAQLYTQALPLADELLLTEIERDFAGDIYFPPWDKHVFKEVGRTRHHAGPPNDFDFSFVTYQRQP